MKAEGHKHSKVQTELAGYVVFRNDPEGSRFYLLLEESESPHRWTVPKGRVRNNETEIQTAIRGFEKETGLSQNDVNVIMSSKIIIESKHTNPSEQITFWLACYHTGTPITLSSKHLQYKWLPLNEALEIADDVVKQALEHSRSYLIKSQR